MNTQTTLQKEVPSFPKFRAKNYPQLVNLKGLSDKLLANHHKLYSAYVTNTNTFIEKMADLETKGDRQSPLYAELKRRFAWEFDSVRLHEYYFENLGGQTNPDAAEHFKEKITGQFGSFEKWRADFLGVGGMRGIGWVLLVQDDQTGRFLNVWIEQHHIGHLVDTHPVLIMDVFEHAYISDYGLEKTKYMEAFFANANWEKALERCR